MANGAIPVGLSVCHRCDVPACINSRRLFLGTQQENMGDRAAKNRRRTGGWEGYARKGRPGRKRPPPPEILRVLFQGEEIVCRVPRVQKPGRPEFED